MLNGMRVLVMEDEYLLAQELLYELEDAGAVVLGPEPSVERGLALINEENRIDVAVLDVNLGGQHVFPVADALSAKKVPFLFSSGYEEMVVLDRYPDVVKCDKPIDTRMLIRTLKRLVKSDHP